MKKEIPGSNSGKHTLDQILMICVKILIRRAHVRTSKFREKAYEIICR